MPTYPAFLIALTVVGCEIRQKTMSGWFAAGMALLLLVQPNGSYGEFARYLPWFFSRPEGLPYWGIPAAAAVSGAVYWLWRNGEWRSAATLALTGILLWFGCGYMIAALWLTAGIVAALGFGKWMKTAWREMICRN